ncbi:MAG TPA: type IV pilus biogenesis/stability protein PilW [Dokdonella sp.]|uniref:type IV pilus biogenesis/stability protein PilW n=1 Tax=Dokdonella sp. TaxID=2291710 RepID=UPI002D8108AB|nr:type IV pilus biogenesis/stability protein PilW [Dokdonella sp.]HET9031621.1 type IV pilus biogenesis/stability protein PilW [Dokdonella sp.]
MRLDRMLVVVGVLALLAGCATGTGTTRRVAESNPENPQTKAATLYTNLGQKYMAQGKLEPAMENLQKALAADANHADAHTVIALLYERIGDNANAEKNYRRAAELMPKSGNENNNYGAFLCKMGRYDDAAVYFVRAISDPFYQTPAVALTNAGTCAIKGGKLDVAEQDLREALNREPNNAEALFQMATVLYRKNDFFRASAFIQRYEAVGQQSADALLLGRNIELRLGNGKAAQNYTRRLRDKFPQSPQARSLDAVIVTDDQD